MFYLVKRDKGKTPPKVVLGTPKTKMLGENTPNGGKFY